MTTFLTSRVVHVTQIYEYTLPALITTTSVPNHNPFVVCTLPVLTTRVVHLVGVVPVQSIINASVLPQVVPEKITYPVVGVYEVSDGAVYTFTIENDACSVGVVPEIVYILALVPFVQTILLAETYSIALRFIDGGANGVQYVIVVHDTVHIHNLPTLDRENIAYLSVSTLHIVKIVCAQTIGLQAAIVHAVIVVHDTVHTIERTNESQDIHHVIANLLDDISHASKATNVHHDNIATGVQYVIVLFHAIVHTTQ